MVQISTPWGDLGNPNPVRRFLSNYFDLLLSCCVHLRSTNTHARSMTEQFHLQCIDLSPVHTGDKVDFNTVDFVESRSCCFSPVHTGDQVDRIRNKVDRIGIKIDRDKLSNSCCCRFVAETGNKVERIRQQSVSARVDFQQSRPC